MTNLLLLLSLFVVQLPLQQAEIGKISGQLRGANGAPAVGVRVAVSLVEADVAVTQAPATLSNISSTDSEGRYTLENVRSGRYLIVAGAVNSPSYFPGVITPNQARIVTVAGGQAVANMDFTLAPTSTVIAGISGNALCMDSAAGIVRMDDGSPLPGQPYERPLQIGINGVSVDVVDRLSCRTFNTVMFRGDFHAGTNVITVTQLPLGYYLKSMTAGNVDLTRAPLIGTTILSGQIEFVKAAPIEVVLTTRPPAGMSHGVYVSGRITNVELPLDSDYKLVLMGDPTKGPPVRIAPTDVPVRRIDGTFVIQAVPPGHYTLRFGASGVKTFDVAGSDVANLELKLEAPPAKSAKPEFPVPLNPNSTITLFGTVEVESGAIPEFEIGFTPTRGSAETRATKISGREFSIALPEGEYRVHISGLPGGYSVASVNAGPLDLTEPFLVISKGIADKFTGVPVFVRPAGSTSAISAGMTIKLSK